MATKSIQDYPIPMRPIVVINRRLQHQIDAVGGFLNGVTFDREGKMKVLAGDTLPIIQPLLYVYDEEVWAGAPKSGHTRGNTVMRAEGTYELFIGVKTDNGFYRRDDADDYETGLYEWVDRIKDSIETKENGATDAALDDTVMEPVTFKVGENYISDLTFALILEVNVATRGFYRGHRSPIP